MKDEASSGSQRQVGDAEMQARREFLKKVGKAGATVPAVALLLAANFEQASAQRLYDGTCGDCSSCEGPNNAP